MARDLPAGVRISNGAGLAGGEALIRLDLLAPENGNGRASLVMTRAEARRLAIKLWDEAMVASGSGGSP